MKALGILSKVTFIGHLGYENQWCKLCNLEFIFEQPLSSLSATRKYAFAGGNISGTPLWKQGFVLQEATTGSGSTRIYTRREVLSICMLFVVKHT